MYAITLFFLSSDPDCSESANKLLVSLVQLFTLNNIGIVGRLEGDSRLFQRICSKIVAIINVGCFTYRRVMNFSKILLFSALSAALTAHAQLNIPLSDVGLAYPAIPAVTLQLGATSRTVLPTPFVLHGVVPSSLLWFCMDPLQTIYYSGSGQPAGSSLNYASTNPADFDKWTPAAPGLSAARRQNLADLFAAFAPTQTNQTTGGALQIAVWEIVNEFDGNSFNLSSGQMMVSGNATLILAAQNMLNSLYTAGVQNRGDVHFLDYLIDGSFTPNRSSTVLVQDLVGYTPVPEPSTYGLGAAGLLMVIVGLKRRRKSGS